jgi:hypothetical protein
VHLAGGDVPRRQLVLGAQMMGSFTATSSSFFAPAAAAEYTMSPLPVRSANVPSPNAGT